MINDILHIKHNVLDGLGATTTYTFTDPDGKKLTGLTVKQYDEYKRAESEYSRAYALYMQGKAGKPLWKNIIESNEFYVYAVTLPDGSKKDGLNIYQYSTYQNFLQQYSDAMKLEMDNTRVPNLPQLKWSDFAQGRGATIIADIKKKIEEWNAKPTYKLVTPDGEQYFDSVSERDAMARKLTDFNDATAYAQKYNLTSPTWKDFKEGRGAQVMNQLESQAARIEQAKLEQAQKEQAAKEQSSRTGSSTTARSSNTSSTTSSNTSSSTTSSSSSSNSSRSSSTTSSGSSTSNSSSSSSSESTEQYSITLPDGTKRASLSLSDYNKLTNAVNAYKEAQKIANAYNLPQPTWSDYVYSNGKNASTLLANMKSQASKIDEDAKKMTVPSPDASNVSKPEEQKTGSDNAKNMDNGEDKATDNGETKSHTGLIIGGIALAALAIFAFSKKKKKGGRK